jgi:flavin-dependent dehydrogenase
MGGLLVAGDAAHMVSPISGEGIFYAVKTGIEAGITAAEAVHAHDCSVSFLARYDSRWQQAIGEALNYQTQIFWETLGHILTSPDPRTVAKQYETGLVDAFMRFIIYMTKKMEARKAPIPKPEMPTVAISD